MVTTNIPKLSDIYIFKHSTEITFVINFKKPKEICLFFYYYYFTYRGGGDSSSLGGDGSLLIFFSLFRG